MKFFENKLIITTTIAFLLITLICLSIYSIKISNKNNDILCENNEGIDNNAEVALNNEIKKMYVDIKGAVKKPGVYQVNEENIINDVINFAGGLLDKAYVENINLSKKVQDELVIYVYTKDEIKKNNLQENQTCSSNNYIITECTENKVSIITSNENNENNENNNSSVSSNLININIASIEELTTLPGIGESKAQNIINYREENGYFKTIDEIKNVNGIGEATFDQLKKYITV